MSQYGLTNCADCGTVYRRLEDLMQQPVARHHSRFCIPCERQHTHELRAKLPTRVAYVLMDADLTLAEAQALHDDELLALYALGPRGVRAIREARPDGHDQVLRELADAGVLPA